jgi:20S proteasome alpha/beta subunit
LETDHRLLCARQEAEELFETVSQCLLSGMDRDALSGWGAIVYVMCALPLLL